MSEPIVFISKHNYQRGQDRWPQAALPTERGVYRDEQAKYSVDPVIDLTGVLKLHWSIPSTSNHTGWTCQGGRS